MGTALNRHQFTVDDFHFLAEQGRLKPGDRLELIEGEIYEMSPIGSLHARCVNFLNSILSQMFAGTYIVSVQNPIIANDYNQLQPDIAVLHHQADFYKNSLPYPPDVLLVIEVADSTVYLDRNIKFPKYALAGISEAWLIDLVSDRIEVHSDPKDESYGTVKFYQRGEEISSATLPEIKFSVDDILG
jgi:Uma2 family endonuclease